MSTLVLDFHCRTSERAHSHEMQQAPPPGQAGNIRRITRLMARALRFEHLLREGAIKDYAELTQLGHVTRARMTQIMGLLNLAVDIQKEIRFLPRTVKGRDPISAREIITIATMQSWKRQRNSWEELVLNRQINTWTTDNLL